MGQAPGPPEVEGTTRGTRVQHTLHVLYLFSGTQRKSSVTSVLQELCHQKGIQCVVHDIDIQNSPEWDLAKGSVQQSLLQRIKAGEFDAVLITPPCSTWSRVRGANCRGPPMIRSRQYVWGFPWLSGRHMKDAELGNLLIHFMLDVMETLEQHPISANGKTVIVFGERPEDLGVAYREEDGMLMDPASIWQLPRLQACVRASSPLSLFTVVFNQCCLGAPYRKPTRLLANVGELRSWGACQWPQFDAYGHYVGPILQCTCRPTVTLARRSHDTEFRTTATSVYPEQMDHRLAQAILAQWLQSPLQAKVGETSGEKKKEVDKGPIKSPITIKEKEVDKRPIEQAEQEMCESKKPRQDPGVPTTRRVPSGSGPPLQVSYKGEVRALHDGAGLCSPGRWPVARRMQPRSEREGSTIEVV